MDDLFVVVMIVIVTAVVGVTLGMLIAPRLGRLDDRMHRHEEADERDGDR